MCGIVGYIGKKQAAPVIVEGLKRLEYRGYDSAGVALLHEGRFTVKKCKGRVQELENEGVLDLRGTLGIGHTRWATHGTPTAENAHPHTFGKFAIVHNGIIENYSSLKEECRLRGDVFTSATDSEVIAHLLDFYYHGNLLDALKKTTERLTGSYALAVLCQDEPDVIAVCRKRSPLIVGMGENGAVIASDIPAVAQDGAKIYSLSDGEFALVEESEVHFYDQKGEIEKQSLTSDIKPQVLALEGNTHFMQKEMSEIPAAIEQTLQNFEEYSCFSEFCEVLCQTEYIHIVACGTAYHSGIAAKYAIEALARIPVEVTIASEYRYSDPIVRKNTLVLAVSQSGETADTLAAAQLAKEKGAYVAAVTNVAHSSLTSLSDFVLMICAGPEIAVAATKSYNAQLTLLYSLALVLARVKGRKTEQSLLAFPALSRQVLASCERVKEFAKDIAHAKHVCFIGRGADYCSALEGSLKLKEITYIPSEGYPAGELKHGTLALIDEETPVIALLTQRSLAEKTMNALSEVFARGGKVFLFTTIPECAERREIYKSYLLPECEELFSPILSVIPLQALAYYTAIERGIDPDKPRHLAKSVTVE